MGILTELKYLLFQANNVQSWIARIVVLGVIAFFVYIYLSEHLKMNFEFLKKRINPELKEKENVILKELQKLNEEENVILKKKKRLRKQIDDIIGQGMVLRRLEEGIKVKAQIKAQKEKTKTEKDEKDEDVKQFMGMVDNWLGKLPKETIAQFSKSKDFKLYKKVLEKYRTK